MSPLFTCHDYLENIDKRKTNLHVSDSERITLVRTVKLSVEAATILTKKTGKIPFGEGNCNCYGVTILKIIGIFFSRGKSQIFFKWIFSMC